MRSSSIKSQKLQQQLEGKLQQRRDSGYFRSLNCFENAIDFCSNDYLGLANSALLKFRLQEAAKGFDISNGSTGARLISGNSNLIAELEHELAAFYRAESGLLFNSGFDANMGLFSCIASEQDSIIYDELVHASIKDGIKLSRGNSTSFAHNDLDDLAEKLENCGGQKMVVVESVYSMGGDFSPLESLTRLCKSFGAQLIVDEAHAVGVIGKEGEGLVKHLGLQKEVFARVVTFGKALGTHGAIVLGSDVLTNYLVNYAHSFVYTTALPPHSILQIQLAHEIMRSWNHKRQYLQRLSSKLMDGLQEFTNAHCEKLAGHIFSFEVPGNAQARWLSDQLLKENIYAKAILFPTVPKGKERLRLSLHAFNTEAEIDQLIKVINSAI